jgi:hypothetical protein
VVYKLLSGKGNIQQITYTIDVYNAPKRLNRIQFSADAESVRLDKGEGRP